MEKMEKATRIPLRSQIVTAFFIIALSNTVSPCSAFSVDCKLKTTITTIPKLGPAVHPNRSAKIGRAGPFHNLANSNVSQRSAGRSMILMASPSTMPHANLAVRLDQPLLPPSQHRPTLLRSILAILLSDIFKTAFVAFFLALVICLITKSSSILSKIYSMTTPTRFKSILSSFQDSYKMARGRLIRVKERFYNPTSASTEGAIPMTFDETDSHSQGWGVCTVSSKTPVGRSSYVQYDFDLPKKENILDLGLGQQITMCCLDGKTNVVKGDFFLYSNEMGKFSVLIPEGNDNLDFEFGKNRGNFAKLLKNELEIGDEVALKPGGQTLQYRGEYLPVTDMLYFASGAGIVPVMEQVKTVLPSTSSSVKGVSVVWINKNEEDFDVAMKTLEGEYFKYSTKLAVSCILDDVKNNQFEKNSEVEEAIPLFNPGVMAVVSGPKVFSEKAKSILIEKGYPDECICVLP